MIEEYELPSYEALLAATLALMTGYAQAAQAEVDPAGRLAASRRIVETLAALRQRQEAPAPLKRLIDRLAGCWWRITCCTALSAPNDAAAAPGSHTRH